MKAAIAISYGYVDEDGIGQTLDIAPGEEIPDEILEEIPEHLMLEKLAEGNPEDLSRDQLMRLAGVGPYAEGDEDDYEVIEYDEESLREALGEFGSKSDIREWWNTIRPGEPWETAVLKLTRPELEDKAVNALLAENEDDEK